MTKLPCSGRAVFRAVLSMGTVAFLCSGLVACSSSSTKPALPIGASDTLGAAAASESGPPATAAGSADTTDPAPPTGASAATDTAATDAAATDTAAASESGPPATAAGGADASHPCALITRAEAESAVGQPLTSGSESPPLGNCVYSTPDFVASVDITVSTWDAITNAAHSSGHTPPAVSGIGDEAFLGAGLSVRKGDKGFLLMVDGPLINKLPDHGLAKEKALAALVLARL